MVIFISEIVIFLKTSKKINYKKMASTWRNFKIIFNHTYVLDLMDLLEQKFCRDSNLRVKFMYESVK